MVFTSYMEIQQIHISINTPIDEYKHIYSQVDNYECMFYWVLAWFLQRTFKFLLKILFRLAVTSNEKSKYISC